MGSVYGENQAIERKLDNFDTTV